MWIRKGVRLLEETTGQGDPLKRNEDYLLSIRITLSQGEIVRYSEKCLSHVIDDQLKTEEDGFFQHRVQIDRGNLVGGFFYAVQGMRVGGYRKVVIAPHLSYGEKGIRDVIPPNAKLTVEIKVIGKPKGRECFEADRLPTPA